MFFSNPYFLNWLTGYLTFWLADWLEIWRRSSPGVPLSYEARISKSDVFFYFFFLSSKRRKAQGNSIILTSKCCHFFNFRNFTVSVVHATAIFILIEMHFGFLVSNNQVDRNHVSPFELVFKNMLYLRPYNFHNF